jgi:hypothetical protein
LNIDTDLLISLEQALFISTFSIILAYAIYIFRVTDVSVGRRKKQNKKERINNDDKKPDNAMEL